MKETGINALMKIILRVLMTLVFCVAGYQFSDLLQPMLEGVLPSFQHPYVFIVICIIIFALIGFAITPFVWWALKKMGQLLDNMLQNVSAPDISIALIGLIVSLLLANLLAIPFRGLSYDIGFYISIALNIVFAFVGMRLCLRRREGIKKRFASLFEHGGLFALKKEKRPSASGDDESRLLRSSGSQDHGLVSCRKVLDTSVLIDGRILDVSETGFLEGELILPRFVLTELQGVADSSDPIRRSRGRKGLSVVSALQKNTRMTVKIEDVSVKELKREKVDEALVELCKRLEAKIITTDFNLNQISRIEGVDVLNVNDLANSLRPQFLPGDVVRADIIRAGKERGQGVGYLEDGTMLVIEDGESSIGETVDITITSMLQTAAGRMVFGKIRR